MRTGVNTGEIMSMVPTKAYRDGYDQIDWGKKTAKKDDVYSHPQCIFKYCPHPEKCSPSCENLV